MNLTPRGQLYIVVVSAVGLLVVGHCITMLLASPIGWEWAVLAGLTLLSGSFTVRVPSFQARISVSETFVFTSVLLFGTCAGTLTVEVHRMGSPLQHAAIAELCKTLTDTETTFPTTNLRLIYRRVGSS